MRLSREKIRNLSLEEQKIKEKKQQEEEEFKNAKSHLIKFETRINYGHTRSISHKNELGMFHKSRCDSIQSVVERQREYLRTSFIEETTHRLEKISDKYKMVRKYEKKRLEERNNDNQEKGEINKQKKQEIDDLFRRQQKDLEDQRKEKQRRAKQQLENCTKHRQLETEIKREKIKLLAEEAARKLEFEKRS